MSASGPPRGLLGLVESIDHKQIGLMYIVSATAFLLVGVAEALLMRIQLMRPLSTFLSPGAYNQIFTMHGTTMSCMCSPRAAC